MLTGGITSLIVVGWISIGTQINMAKGFIRFPQKPTSIEGCATHWKHHSFINMTANSVLPNDDPPFIMYRISYMYYTLVGCATAVIIGLFISYITGGNKDKKLDKSLFSPVIHRFLHSPSHSVENNCNSNSTKDVKMNHIKY